MSAGAPYQKVCGGRVLGGFSFLDARETCLKVDLIRELGKKSLRANANLKWYDIHSLYCLK